MWFNENIVSQFNLPILNRPRWDYVSWAHTILPPEEFKYHHPYCKQIETILLRSLARNLASLTSIGKVQVARYRWRADQLMTGRDHVNNMMELTDETGTNFIGDHKSPSVYTYPCIGVAPSERTEGEFIPIFLTDEDMANRSDWQRDRSVFIRTRPLDLYDFQTRLRTQLIRSLRQT